jgi:CelD/BcsL family acetyltransferase involved in cellulose biosynthesis
MSATALDNAVRDAEKTGTSEAMTTNVRVVTSLGAAESVWRRLEASAVLTPYQRFDWMFHVVASRDVRPALAIVILEEQGAPIALLPLEIGRRFGVKVASLIGSDIGNADWMILDRRHAALTPERLREALAAASRAVDGIDLCVLRSQPAAWDGVDNPLLAFPHQPGPDHLYLGTLNERGGFARFDEKRLTHFERRKRKLAAAHGEVILKRAQNAEEIDSFHRAFLEQRAVRFAQMGIPNIFAEPHFVRLFREGAIASLGEERPAIVFHALFAGERIVATALGSFGGNHYTQYINATAGGDVAKFRLISVLMHELFADAAASGATSIDMGLGDFDYKTDWTAPATVYDGMIPLSLRGRLVGAAVLATRGLKRRIKQHDRLWSVVRKLRGAVARRQPEAPPEH